MLVTLHMHAFKQKNKGNSVLWLIGLLAVGVILFLVLRSDRKIEPIDNGQAAGVTAETTVLEGEVVCLPHRNTTGPVTLECAYGLKTDDGKYYALDTTGLPAERQGGYEVGNRTAFEGTLVPVEQIPANLWATYNISGQLLVQDYWEYRDK